MSRIRLTKVAQPATPSANKSELFVDTNDRRLKQIDDLGVVSVFAAGYEKNMLINGGFDFCQRAAVALNNITSPSATNRVFSADRWGFTVGNTTTPQFEQVDTIAGIESGITARYYGRYKQLTNAAKIALTQTVLARDTATVRGRVVRFQIKARLNVGANRTMRLGLITNTGTADAPTAGWISAFNGAAADPTLGASLAYITPSIVENGTIVGSNMNFTLTNTWTRFSAIFTVPTTCKNLMPVVFSDTTFAANDDLCITECSLTDGADQQDWIPLPTSTELVRCQMFYCKTFALGTVPAASTLPGAILWGVGVAGAVAAAWGQWKFPVRMNKAPTITLWNPSAAGAQVRQLSATAGDCTSSSATSITDSGCQFTATPGATAVIGSVLGVNASCEAEL
jgi:hypothetical protein